MTLSEDQWCSEVFRAHLVLSYQLQDFYLPHLAKDCIYHKEDNSSLLLFLERELVLSGLQSDFLLNLPVSPLKTIIKMIHFVWLRLRPLSACIYREELKALLVLPPSYYEKGTRDSEWQMFLPLVLFQVLHDLKNHGGRHATP